ncbi:hypothetical protein EIP86_009176 [Pleurotus ostreatoroseus]|nr:hypothetical protein EIP86_009176 [Pleurotus ostreatoroseus]
MSASRRSKRRACFHVVEDVEQGLSTVYDATSSNRRVRRRRNVENIIITEPSPPAEAIPAAPPSLEPHEWEDEPQAEEIEGEVPGIKIRAMPGPKHYDTTAAPLSVWLPYRTEYLLEYCRHDGRRGIGDLCDACQEQTSVAKCEDCFVDEVLCEGCVLRRHARNPLHFIKVWQDDHFVRRSLFDLGLVVQLGHGGRGVCLKHVSRTLVVIHSNGVHKVNARFCDCQVELPRRVQLMRQGWWPATSTDPRTCATFDVLRRFHHLNLQCHTNAYDFYQSLENMTDPWHLEKLPERLSSFMLIVRQYRNVKALKRAGRQYEEGGVEATKCGDLALLCRACPHPRTLPENWQKAPPEYAFLYWMFLAMDANFRQKNRHRPTTYKDTCLSPGWAYFVETEAYMEHVRKYATQEEISGCVAFSAMLLANLKKARGLSATGVGGCCCARHDMWRPNGLGDLQRGERFCNMDYILFSSLLHLCLLLALVISYDIACQYFKNLWSRLEDMPPALRLPIKPSAVKTAVPKGHLHAHVPVCHAPFSFNYMPGAGRTSGEGIESNWSVLNKAAPSCKEMGPSARRETLDDFCGFHNWRKTIGLGDLLLRRMLDAIKNEGVFRNEYEALERVLNLHMPDDVQAWKSMLKAWEQDHSQPCPYERSDSSITVDQVRLALAVEEEAALTTSTASTPEASPSGLLLAALEIEKEQIQIKLERNNPYGTASALNEAGKLERRNALRRKIRRFREQLFRLMPRLRGHLPPLVNDAPAPPVQEEPLHLPSSLDPEVRIKVCDAKLVNAEERLREADCYEQLANLRGALNARLIINSYKVKNAVGQRENTRARDALASIEAKIIRFKHEYRRSREALYALRGPGDWEQDLRELRDQDVRAINERALTAQELHERQQAMRLAGRQDELQGVVVNNAAELGDGSRALSWIWAGNDISVITTIAEGGTGLPGNVNMEALRVEWAKSLARALRFREEILLIAEEMRRAILYCEIEAFEWIRRAQIIYKSTTLSPEERDALTSYAMERSRQEEALGAKWAAKWQVVRVRASTIRRELLSQLPHRPVELDPLDEVDEDLLDSDEDGGDIREGDVGASVAKGRDADSDDERVAEPEVWVELVIDGEDDDDDDDDVDEW